MSNVLVSTFSLYGKSSRKEFSYFHLVLLIIFIIIGVLRDTQTIKDDIYIISLLVFSILIIFLIPLFYIKRIRDTGLSLWYFLLIFFPFINIIFYLSLFILPSDRFKN